MCRGVAMKRIKWLAAVLVAATIAVVGSATSGTGHAQAACTINWQGGDGGWHDAAHWDTNTVPATGDVACLADFATVTGSWGSFAV